MFSFHWLKRIILMHAPCQTTWFEKVKSPHVTNVAFCLCKAVYFVKFWKQPIISHFVVQTSAPITDTTWRTVVFVLDSNDVQSKSKTEWKSVAHYNENQWVANCHDHKIAAVYLIILAKLELELELHSEVLFWLVSLVFEV